MHLIHGCHYNDDVCIICTVNTAFMVHASLVKGQSTQWGAATENKVANIKSINEIGEFLILLHYSVNARKITACTR